MFTKDEIGRALGITLGAPDKMRQEIELWSNLYEGNTPWIRQGIKSLGLPAAVAGELARLSTIELRSSLSGSARADYLNNAYQEVIGRVRVASEYACAKGGLVLKPYLTNGHLAVDLIQADCFYPLAQGSDGTITEAVFVDQIRKGGRYVTRLEYHKLTNERYLIKNRAFESEAQETLGRQVSLASVPAWADMTEDVLIQNASRPLFSYFKMPFANTIDTHSPIGVSCYARANALFEQADRQFTRLLWEFESGERALYVDETAFRRNPRTGELELPDERLYRTLDMGLDGGFFQDFSPNFREQSILNGLDSILMRIEDSCGLARGTFSTAQEVAKTATELRILRQRSYATVADTQNSLRAALSDLAQVLSLYADLYQLAPAGKVEASFEFDDSLVTDRSAEFEEKRQLTEAGIMQPWELRMWYFGESEEAAKAALLQQV